MFLKIYTKILIFLKKGTENIMYYKKINIWEIYINKKVKSEGCVDVRISVSSSNFFYKIYVPFILKKFNFFKKGTFISPFFTMYEK